MNWSLKQIFAAMGSLVAVLAVITVASVIMSSHYTGVLSQAATNRYQMYQLADELRQSSDDLTRLARTYVVSGGEVKWEKQYFEILDIRNGKIPRPQGYGQIYWDFRAADVDPSKGAGETVALIELMKKYGISEAELAKLSEAQANSNELVQTETIAMNMVKGLYADSNGGFTVKGEPDLAKAREMMHNLAYHQYKAKIMKPVNEFFVLLNQRTEGEFANAQALSTFWEYVAIALAVVMSVLVLIALFVVKRRTSALIKQVSIISEEISEGNLSQKIDTSDHSEEGRLLSIMSTMQDKLAGVVGTIRVSAEGVATASSEIAQGNIDLSHRTEEQASSLEETSASMEELGSTVRQNADNAKQANELAMKASTVAIKGGEVVSDVVNTMKGINEASQKTNSVERVEQGTALVDQTGMTMNEVVTSIRHVTDIMNEINNASSEQSDGITQVGDAVTQMDENTQQNAALVEQTAAAAESLKNQAQQLVKAIAMFQINQNKKAVNATPNRKPTASASMSKDKGERRGPNRAQNVTRPNDFGAQKAKTGTDEEWDTF